MLSTFIAALVSQGMGLFNKFSVHDDPMNYWVGATYTSGRWMLDILEILERKFYGDIHYSLPAYNGFLGIFLIAVSACLIIKLIDIHSPFLCSFIAGIMVCFPVITSIFGFMLQWTGYAPVMADAESFSEMDEVKQMPSYPDNRSIAVIDETVVVKF